MAAKKSGAKARRAGGEEGKAPTVAATPVRISAWIDDPMSGAGRRHEPLPDPSAPALRVRILGEAPPPGTHPLGTTEFRWWNAASILARGAAYWSRLLPPGAQWQTGPSLDVILDGGRDLNAYYDRASLSFFHAEAGGRTVYSGESPDIVLHEMGHAIADILSPDLWDAQSTEPAAFHEAAGDIAAILVHLDDPQVCEAVVADTGGSVNRASRISRLAEELGWAIRQGRPDGVAPDCLRNAANSFVYSHPSTIPSSGPDWVLSAEPHSFSRVFTGAFLDAIAGMCHVAPGESPAARLHAAAQAAARIFVAAVPATPVVYRYFSQAAVHMIEADASLFGGRYTPAVRSAFVRRGILSLGSVPAAAKPAAGPGAAAVAAAGPRTRRMDGSRVGLEGMALEVAVAAGGARFAVTSSAGSAARDGASDPDAPAEEFVKYLIRRGRVTADADLSGALPVTAPVHKTHRLEKHGNGSFGLRRLRFDCGFD